jgi:hypothetical protein
LKPTRNCNQYLIEKLAEGRVAADLDRARSGKAMNP